MNLLRVLASPFLVLVLLKNGVVHDVRGVVIYLMDAFRFQLDGRRIRDAGHSDMLLELFDLGLEDGNLGAS